ncbi:hypothetical protein GCM10025870_24650 [Agromyces marinus]|uniref:LysR substrate-binding domain-containing protein n=1 Tax=Agromyces marinus TaxID=1389020 RepID=A0ABN6YDA7_9MICO|nr:hypothetical protein GCM10025870_24650 [Agromyces marinus]
MQEHDGLAVAVARDLPVDVLAISHVEHSRLERFDLRIQFPHSFPLVFETLANTERMPRARRAAAAAAGCSPGGAARVAGIGWMP